MAKKKHSTESPSDPSKKRNKAKADSGATIGFEEQLWASANKLRGSVDAADYKHIVLGLMFLKHISDSFLERRSELEALTADENEADYFTKNEKHRQAILEDKDEYLSEGVFWVPEKSRWSHLQDNAKNSNIARMIDDAMDLLEKDNRRLKGVLPAEYAKRNLDPARLGELVDLISSIQVGGKEAKSKDVLGRVYEYFLGKFASAEGKLGGEFFTPRCIVRLLVEMLEPYKGRIYDPCCGSGGMFVQSEKFVEAHGGKIGDISVYGQELNQTTWRLCHMNLAMRGIEADLGETSASTFTKDQHKDLKADFIIANPPFNISDWQGDQLQEDARWKYGVPPVGNANYGWIQHMISKLSPNGTAGFVMSNGSLSTESSGEGDIREAILRADLVDCVISLPSQLFYTTQIPACLWFLSRKKSGGKFRDRQGETLFIDARKLGSMVSRTNRELMETDIRKVADTYHAWRNKDGKYEDVAGFCKSAKLAEIEKHGFVLTPGRFVGAEEVEDDGEDFSVNLKRLSDQLMEQFAESDKIQTRIKKALASIEGGRP